MNENTESKYEDFKEFLQLLWINTCAQTLNFFEFVRVVFAYYTDWRFCKIDLTLLLTYLFNNPFVISKRFRATKGEKEIYAYGETPLTTLDQIARECKFTATDKVFELGCGRGRTCFWLNEFIGCHVVGIEYIPEFVTRANEIKAKFGITNVEFRQQDMLGADYSGATVIYLYGTSLEDDVIVKLIDRFRDLPSGTKIVTISFALTEYTSEQTFELMKQFPVRFPWGVTDAYLHLVR